MKQPYLTAKKNRFLMGVALTFFLATPNARAIDPPACVTQMQGEYQDRLSTLHQRLERYGNNLTPAIRQRVDALLASPSGSLREWCSNNDALRAMHYWRTLQSDLIPHLPRGRESLLSAFGAMARTCHFTRESIRNAALLIDWLYWYQQADTLGIEVADALDFRDFLYEGAVVTQAARLLRENQESIQENVRSQTTTAPGQNPNIRTGTDCHDFLNATAPLTSRIMQTVGDIATLLDSEQRAAVHAVSDELNMRGDSFIIFGRDILTSLENREDLQFLNQLFSELQAWSGPRRRELGVAHGGWRRLLELAGGNRQRVMRVLGTLTSQRDWPLDNIGSALARRGQLTCEKLRALEQGSIAYYRLNALDERAAVTSEDGSSLSYHFFYPPEYSTRNWKIYHWFANGHLGCNLRRRGLSPRAISFGARRLAQAYEYASLTLTGPTWEAMGIDPRVRPMLEGFDDVEINTEGAEYGARLCAGN
jgi:hypothetical protein